MAVNAAATSSAKPSGVGGGFGFAGAGFFALCLF
jgi:uncharacterized membrane protein